MSSAGHPPEDLPFVTPPGWAITQVPQLAELLVEQAHLEKKAAACAVSFLFRVPMRASLHRALSVLAREELVHFERTLRLLHQRDLEFVAQAPSAYASRLKTAASTTMPARLADELLIAGIIEARSHERMGLLATAFASSAPDVAEFYRELCAAEARHREIYVDLAGEVMPAADVAARQLALWQHEANVLRALPWSPRLHSGLLPPALSVAESARG